MRHQLKCLPVFFWAIHRDEKTFELRRDDRGFEVGDTLDLREWDGEYTGAGLAVRVSYVLRGPGYGLEAGYVCLGIAR